MPVKRILLLIWVSLMLLAAIYFLIQNSGPRSTLTTELDITKASTMILYGDAKVEKTENDNGEIKLLMTGKAFVDIAENDEATINLYTEQAKITLSPGTAVIDATEPYTTILMVASGSMDFDANPDNTKRNIRSIKISEGEKGLISPNARGVIKQNIRDKNYMSWIDFNFYFERTSLSEVITTLNEAYGSSIVEPNPNISRCVITSNFKELSLQKLLEELTTTNGWELQENEEGMWEISGESCP